MAMEQGKTGNAFVDAQDMKACAAEMDKVVAEECGPDEKLQKAVTILMAVASGARPELRTNALEGIAVGLADLTGIDVETLLDCLGRALLRMLAYAADLRETYYAARDVEGMTRQ